jgi:tRNA (mo5U34)-methyltransferase
MDPDDRARLRAAIEAHSWYHTIELAPGLVTPGWFDTRRVAPDLPMPASLDGARCLDVGTFDGFWAFEMERRGAAEVVAIDVLDPAQWDWPVGSDDAVLAAVGERKAAGAGFGLAHRALGSAVVRHELSVYDLDDSLGSFDFVYVGSLLLHLRDPVRALERVASVCRGQALMVDAVDLVLSRLFRRQPLAGLDGRGRPWWWKPNAAGLGRMVEAAGFEIMSGPEPFFMPHGPGQVVGRPAWRVLRSRDGIEAHIQHRWGDPHAAILARPRGAG